MLAIPHELLCHYGHLRPVVFSTFMHAAGTERLGSLGQPAMMQTPYMSSHAAGAFTTGDRLRLPSTTSRKRSKRDESPDNDPSLRSSPGDDMKKTRGSLRSRSKVNYAEAEAFADITDDDAPEANSDEERKQKQKNAVAAFDDTSELDDEVEKVLAHRCELLMSLSCVFMVTSAVRYDNIGSAKLSLKILCTVGAVEVFHIRT